MSDFIPDSAENRLTWFTNFSSTGIAAGPSLEWNTGKIEQFDLFLRKFIQAYQDVVDTDTAARKAKADAKEIFAENSPQLRAIIAEIKTNPKFTDGLGEAMRIFTTGNDRAPEDIKPSLRVTVDRGFVLISGSKDYAETINIYMRRKAGPGGQWRQIAVKRRILPYEDETPLEADGIPEEREYMARGVIADREVGQDSDIVSVVFAG
jgi:hypothetical protein